jgi:hypothetical protein
LINLSVWAAIPLALVVSEIDQAMLIETGAVVDGFTSPRPACLPGGQGHEPVAVGAESGVATEAQLLGQIEDDKAS